MAGPRYSFFNTLVHRITSSRVGARFFSRIAHHLDRAVLKLTGGRTTLTGLVAGVPVVVLTAIGARSGLPRTVPLLFIRDERNPNRFALIASNWGQRRYPAWYHNLKANPHAICSINGRRAEYVADEASDEEYERYWRQAVKLYPGFANYKQRASERRIPIMVMTPVDQ